MAMLKYAAGVIEIEGKFGGEIFRHDQCVNHVQAKPRYIDPHTIGQRRQRDYFSRASLAWQTHDWTAAELRKWWIWCYSYPVKNKKGEMRYYHPYIGFLSINIRRLRDGRVITFEPPL